MSAMTGGTMKVPSRWTLNTRVTRIAKGDLVFVFGERVGRTLKAQLVLFAAPATTNRKLTATPTAKPTVTAPAPAPTGVGATITGTHF
jgi:monoamine oxidase